MARDKKDAQKMKLGFWSKLGGWFRGSAITTLSTAAVIPALRFVAGPIVARSGASWAGALASVADTLWLGGVGLQLLGVVAIPAVFVAGAYAVSPKLREHMKQKALLAKLQNALKRNKELTLTEEQKRYNPCGHQTANGKSKSYLTVKDSIGIKYQLIDTKWQSRQK